MQPSQQQHQQKPRISYPQFAAALKATVVYQPRSIAWMVQELLQEEDEPGARQYCQSRSYTFKILQRAPIGAVLYRKLEVSHIIDHCKARIAQGAAPQTVAQDATYLSSLVRHAVEVCGWKRSALKTIEKAKPQLRRLQLIAKSPPRTRRPTQDELDRLLALCADWDLRPKSKIPMAAIIRIQSTWARRISETCRITRKDVDVARRMCFVRDLKNPNGKGFHAWFPLLPEAWAIVEQRLKEIPDEPDARLFPYRAKSVEAKFIKMKHALGITGLRLHDLRRESISRLFEQGYGVPEVACVSLHFNPAMLLGRYTRLNPEDLHRGPAARRAAAGTS